MHTRSNFKNSSTSNSTQSLEANDTAENDLIDYENFQHLIPNITRNDLRRFMEFMQRYNERYTNQTLTQYDDYGMHDEHSEKCSDYCTGNFYQLLKAYNGIHGYVALLICVFGTIANILNVMVLTRKDMAKAPINKILKWLAVTDTFVMLEYIPFASYQYIYMRADEKDFSYLWAVYILFHMHFTQVLHTISIGLTVTLAIWRYIVIRHPHGVCASFLHSHYNEIIIMPFAASPLACFPTLFVFKVKKRLVSNSVTPLYLVDADKDTKLYRINFWINSVLIKMLPCCILTVISFVLVNVLCAASKRKQKLKEFNCNGNNKPKQKTKKSKKLMKCDRRTDRTTMLLVAVLILFLITEFPQGILALMSGVMEKCFFNACYPPFGELMDLLALVNAALDFVLYGLMSKQFRNTFKSLFIKSTVLHGNEIITRATRLTATCV